MLLSLFRVLLYPVAGYSSCPAVCCMLLSLLFVLLTYPTAHELDSKLNSIFESGGVQYTSPLTYPTVSTPPVSSPLLVHSWCTLVTVHSSVTGALFRVWCTTTLVDHWWTTVHWWTPTPPFYQHLPSWWTPLLVDPLVDSPGGLPWCTTTLVDHWWTTVHWWTPGGLLVEWIPC